jgi:putative MFS transporter
MASKGNYSIDEALESVGFGRFQWTLLLLSGIGFCATTVELISVSLLRAPLMEQWPDVPDWKFAYLASATFAGELLGGLGWGAISDRLGRKTTFAGTALMAAIFGMMGAFVPCFYTFAITRFCLGLAIGGSLAIDFVYFVEFVPATSRGFRTTFIILLGIMACKSFSNA